MPAEARCQANRGINVVGFRKLTKYCDSFRFLKLFCVHFCWEGTTIKYMLLCAKKEQQPFYRRTAPKTYLPVSAEYFRCLP